MRPWWRRPEITAEDQNHRGHADPALERKSAQVLGRLDEVCDQLSQALAEVNTITGEIDMDDVREQARRQTP